MAASEETVGKPAASWSGARTLAAFVAIVGFASIALRYAQTLQVLSFADGTIRFFSFFTILSNTLATLVAGLVAFAPTTALGRLASRPAVATAPTLYMLITGIIYVTLLRPLETFTGWEAVSNSGLHYVMPVLVALFWLFTVAKGALWALHVVWWLIFPVAYAAFTLLRGPFIAWYPYPFIDATLHGPIALAVNILVITIVFAAVGFALVAVDGWVARSRRGEATAG